MAVPDDMSEFIDKVVVVTGAAGNLGAATADAFAARMGSWLWWILTHDVLSPSKDGLAIQPASGASAPTRWTAMRFISA